MKKILFIILLICVKQANAQTVIIPDTAFVSYLHTVIPTAMTGNLMDTSSTAVTTLDSIDVYGDHITNLSGVQYFTSLTYLQCGINLLTTLPALPNSIQTLKCYNNQLTSLPALPNSLRNLLCSTNQLTSLPSLPDSLLYLDCHLNQLTYLPALPDSLQRMDCSSNQLTSLPALDNQLWDIRCNSNQITTLPTLPNIIVDLSCYHNLLTSLPLLPNNIAGPFFEVLDCSYNQLTSLPALPHGLLYFLCSNNQITNLPALPPILQDLFCQQNQLTNLPALPNYLRKLGCNNNNIPCFPIFPNTLITPAGFNISNNPFNCLPNYVTAMNATTLAIPLCTAGNTNGCAVGINEIQNQESISIFPNPVSSILTVRAEKEGIKNICVMNALGEILLKEEVNEKESNFDISTLSKGMYICTVISKNKKTTLKFIKQ